MLLPGVTKTVLVVFRFGCMLCVTAFVSALAAELALS